MCRAVGHRQTTAGTILVDRRAANHRKDSIPSAAGIREPFEHDDATAFAAHIAIGRGIEGLTARLAGEHVAPRKHGRRARFDDDIDATSQRRATLAVT